MNTVQLINYLEQIALQIPLVHSFYSGDVYQIWNTKEVKYGSLCVGIRSTHTIKSTIQHEVVLYYADRLNESGDNADMLKTDAVTVLNAVTGVIFQDQDNNVSISYPIDIEFFEQKFADMLVGGYTIIKIESEYKPGECGYDVATPEMDGNCYYLLKDINKRLENIRFGK